MTATETIDTGVREAPKWTHTKLIASEHRRIANVTIVRVPSA
jgi:hypothetical protein